MRVKQFAKKVSLNVSMVVRILIGNVYGNLLKALVELKPLVELDWVNLLKASIELKPSIELKKREPPSIRLTPYVHAWEIRERNQVQRMSSGLRCSSCRQQRASTVVTTRHYIGKVLPTQDPF